MFRELRTAVGIALALGVLTLGGCSGGSKGVKLQGRLVKNGQPVKPSGNDYYQIILLPSVEGKANGFPATPPKEDGTFTVDGPDGKGVPPGNYKVSVKNMVDTKTGPMDKLNGKFSEQSTTLTWQVNAGDTSVHDVDIGK